MCWEFTLLDGLSHLPGAITVHPKIYAHGFCFAVLCCGYTLTDFPISIRLTSLALWQSNDCPSASKTTLMNMDKYFMWMHYERLHNHNKATHNKTVCIFLGIYSKRLYCVVNSSRVAVFALLGSLSHTCIWVRELCKSALQAKFELGLIVYQLCLSTL